MASAVGKAVMEIRVAMCQSSAGSAGIREFWQKNYAAMKAANAKLPIVLRESSGTSAKLTAVYEFGEEKTVDVEGMSSTDFGSKLKELVK